MGLVNPPAEWRPHPRYAHVFQKPLVTRETNSGMSVHLVYIAPGGSIAFHAHDASTETFYILSGRGECKVGDELFALAPGICAFAPPGVTHSVRNTGDGYLEAISMFNPPLA